MGHGRTNPCPTRDVKLIRTNIDTLISNNFDCHDTSRPSDLPVWRYDSVGGRSETEMDFQTILTVSKFIGKIREVKEKLETQRIIKCGKERNEEVLQGTKHSCFGFIVTRFLLCSVTFVTLNRISTWEGGLLGRSTGIKSIFMCRRTGAEVVENKSFHDRFNLPVGLHSPSLLVWSLVHKVDLPCRLWVEVD